jgi:hypothetical protein
MTVALLALAVAVAAAPANAALGPSLPRVKAALVARHGEAQRARAERGVDQMAASWRPTDGDARAFAAFTEASFVSDPAALDATFARFEEALEQLDGHFLEVNRFLARHAVLELGPMVPVDPILAAVDAGAHLTDDLFDSKLAFAALLNFPLTTLAERLEKGERWTRREWAEARLLGRRGALGGASDGGLSQRTPAAVRQAIARAYAGSQAYVADYNLYLHHVLSEKGERLFPKGLRLLSHWNLRDEIKASYALPDGLARQRVIAKAMERIVTQAIPRAAVNDPRADWNPFTNIVRPAPADAIEGGAKPLARVDPSREPDTRYAWLLANFEALRAADPFSPAAPTFIARKFEVDREMSEARVAALLESVVASPLVPRVARVIERRLGRPLEPHDVWYAGFRPLARHSEADLDAMTRARYPTAEAYAADVPRMLEALGFPPEKARFLAGHIAVEPARGSGHALQAARRGDDPHLRTRVGAQGMDYKGYNIAVHEMGHCVEQVFSLYEVDHTLLSGVPNNAFTEALAMVLQARDLELLGLGKPDAEAERLLALDDFWATYEIAGVGLVDIGVWHWLYQNPKATPAALRQAVVRIARDVWNRHYAPVLGGRDTPLLAVYSHMIEEPLYLPDYPLGHLIAAQIEEQVRKAGVLGPEFERMARFGSVAPDLWMRNAVGEPVSEGALLRAAEAALAREP